MLVRLRRRASIVSTVTITSHPHEVNRLAVAVGAGFADFCDRYEQNVPSLDCERLAAFVREGADWDTVLRATPENAPHGFIRYWTFDYGSLMRLAGDSLNCKSYLMGNHTIAERMYRHDPGIMLYAPLRTAIHEDVDGTTWFSFDQPSSRFRSYRDPAITYIGLALDHKIALLLEHLGAPVPGELADKRLR
jgi:hypothetical protein